MAGDGRPEHGNRGDERPLRSRAMRITALAVVTACVGAGAFGAVGAAKPPAGGPGPSCPPGHQYGGPPGHQYGGPPGHQYGGPPGHQYGGPPGHQYGGPPGHQDGC
jgi:hypothetical protein